jgi:hypothetical protein
LTSIAIDRHNKVRISCIDSTRHAPKHAATGSAAATRKVYLPYITM